MRLRRFTGKHPREALAQVKATLGPEAVILGTRPLADGGVEITAAVDLDALTGSPEAAVPPTAETPTVAPASVARELETLAARVARLDSTLASRLDRVLTARGGRAPDASPAGDAPNDEARSLAERLALHGTPFALADATARSFARARRKGIAPAEALAASIARHLVAPEPAVVPRVTALVGPTGGGKTTTLVKLAAQALARGASVALVTADTQRIGAAEQLGIYARLLEVPVRTVHGPDEMTAALAALADRDAVYVDTPGLTGDGAVAGEVARICGGDGVAAMAVIPANVSEAAFRIMWRQMDRLDPVASVVTKVDERAGLGAACAWLADVGVPLAWLGTGTRVPDDLVAADPQELAAWLTAA